CMSLGLAVRRLVPSDDSLHHDDSLLIAYGADGSPVTLANSITIAYLLEDANCIRVDHLETQQLLAQGVVGVWVAAS
ncbi:MAG: hypothetical protein ACRD1T_26275, partial [Acidimicrobiia bacterium]